jgi:molecular chaperone DnaK (HSP70)
MDSINGSSVVPSVVAYLPDGKVLVGWNALKMRNKIPAQNIIINFKRLIGKQYVLFSVHIPAIYAQFWSYG